MEPLNSLHVYYIQNRRALHTLLTRLSSEKVPGAACLYARLLAAADYGDFEKYASAERLCDMSEKLRDDAFCLLYELFSIDAAAKGYDLLLGMQALPFFSNHDDHLAFLRYFCERKLQAWKERPCTNPALTGQVLVTEEADVAEVAISLTFDAAKPQTYRRRKSVSLGYTSIADLFAAVKPLDREAGAWVDKQIAAAAKKAAQQAAYQESALVGLFSAFCLLFNR